MIFWYARRRSSYVTLARMECRVLANTENEFGVVLSVRMPRTTHRFVGRSWMEHSAMIGACHKSHVVSSRSSGSITDTSTGRISPREYNFTDQPSMCLAIQKSTV